MGLTSQSSLVDSADQQRGQHVVVVVDLVTGETSVLGPFREPLDALVFADQYVRDVGAEADSMLLTVTTLDPT